MTAAPSDLIWITKRRYMGKDLIDDRFGRYFEIPARLSDRWNTHVFCLDYANRRALRLVLSDRLTVSSHPASGFARFLADIRRTAGKAAAPVLIGGADAPYCVLAQRLAGLLRAPYAVDLYDDYRTFASARAPLMGGLFRNAVRRADARIVFEEAYRARLAEETGCGVIAVAPNGVDRAVFRPRDRGAMRRRYGLDDGALIIGYFGAMTHDRTMDDIASAFMAVRTVRPDAVLLAAGVRENGVLRDLPGFDHRGVLPQTDVARLMNACDVGLASVRKDASAEICFPAKLMEYAASGLPFVTPAVGGACDYLRDHPDFLYPAGSADDLAARILAFAADAPVTAPPVHDWDDAAAAFAAALDAAIPQPAQEAA